MFLKKYVPYHVHSHLSNVTTNIDSVTFAEEYIKKARELDMTAFAFSEHGNTYNWFSKKKLIEDWENKGKEAYCPLKYIHAVELYVTKTLQEKIRDNYHIILIARNHEGFKELNKLMSIANNRDTHFYYTPRISFQELISTSNNIIITTACLGGILGKTKKKDTIHKDFIRFLSSNKHRCFLEIQPHNNKEQIKYNQYMLELSKKHNVPLIAGTDTHNLDEEKARLRILLQKSKKVFFDGEENWDLNFKSYNELVKSFQVQNSMLQLEYLTAIDNTNKMADMVEEFEIDLSPKYPKIYKNSEKYLREQIKEGIKTTRILNRYSKEVVDDRIEEEIRVYKQCGVIDFILFEEYLRKYELENEIYRGYGRGSACGSLICYLLGVTEVNPFDYNLSLYRFLNPARLSLADIDVDYCDEEREKVKAFLFSKDDLHTSEIMAYNTIAEKGAIKDVGRAMEIDFIELNKITANLENEEEKMAWMNQYPQLFEDSQKLEGVIVSGSIHPAGIICSDLDISETIGLSSSKNSPYPVACCDMGDIDEMMYVKLDRLGLNNVGLINKTCKLANIKRINPDNIDLDDDNVWETLVKDQTCVFQFESPSARNYTKRFFRPNIIKIFKEKGTSRIEMLAMLSAILRPGADSFRDDMLSGKSFDHGNKELNEFLKDTLGYIIYQEQVSEFLKKFCGYDDGEADKIRKGIAKKKGTEKLIPEIEANFIRVASKDLHLEKKECESIVKPFLQIILDASKYLFNKSHAIAYAMISYGNAYLKHYHSLEFTCVSLNTWQQDLEKTSDIISMSKLFNIKLNSIEFGKSKSNYFINNSEKAIYKGTSSVKGFGLDIGDRLFKMSRQPYNSFSKCVSEIVEAKIINKTQMKTLIKLNYFQSFGRILPLLKIFETFENKKAVPKAKRKIENQLSMFQVEDYDFIDKSMREFEEKIHVEFKNKKITLKQFMKIQLEAYEYVEYTNESDKFEGLAFVTDTEYLYSKKLGKHFAVKISYHSIRTGKTGSFVCFLDSFDGKSMCYNSNPIRNYDIIRVLDRKYSEKYDSWNLNKWQVVA